MEEEPQIHHAIAKAFFCSFDPLHAPSLKYMGWGMAGWGGAAEGQNEIINMYLRI